MVPLRALSRLTCHSSCTTSTKQCKRRYSAAVALAMPPDMDEQEVPLAIPALQDTYVQRAGRGPQLIFLGTPGVNKGMYANRLAKLLNVPHISMGNLLRKEAAASSTFSKELCGLMIQGKLLPDNLIFSILLKRLDHKVHFEPPGFVLDGFPRTMSQAEFLDEIAAIDLVIHMKVEDNVMLKSLDGALCAECKQVLLGGDGGLLNKSAACIGKEMVSVLGGTCCSIRKRLDSYVHQCKPVEHHYNKKGKLLEFEVQGGLPQTWPRLLSALHIQDREMILHQQISVSVHRPSIINP